MRLDCPCAALFVTTSRRILPFLLAAIALPVYGQVDPGPPRAAVSADLAEVSNGILQVDVDLKHPAISVLRYSPSANWQFQPNLFGADSNGVHGITTHIGKGVIDTPGSRNSTSTLHVDTFTRTGFAGVNITNISVSGPGGGNPIAHESWALTLPEGDSEGVVWDRTVLFLQPVDLTYAAIDGGNTGSLPWVDTVTVARSGKDLADTDFLPLLTQVEGDVPATVYSSLSGELPDGKSLQAGQILANSLRGFHAAGEQVHLRYRLKVVDTRSWFTGLPTNDRKALIHALWYGQVTRQWRGSVGLPGFKSLGSTDRSCRWLSLEESLPLAASLWSPHRFLDAATLWWTNYDQWVVLGQANEVTDLTGEQPETGFMVYRISDGGVPTAGPGLSGPLLPSTQSLPIDIERLYAFTKDRFQLGRLMPRLRQAHLWIERHPQGLFYQGAALQALANLYQQAKDANGLARAQHELDDWKQKLAGLWSRAWLEQQDYRELTAAADYNLLTTAQEKDLHALIVDYADSEIPPASRTLSKPRSAGDYATGLFAQVFRARSGDADRAYEMASSVVSRIQADAREPFQGFDPAGKSTGDSGYGAGSAVVGMYAWGLFGFAPSTVDNEFTLQPEIPAAWNGQPVSFNFEYALSSDQPASGLAVTYQRKGDDLDTLLTISGVRPGQHRLEAAATGAPVVVEGTARGTDFLFHLALKNGTRYHFRFIPAVTTPGPALQTIRYSAADPGTGLGAGQTIGTLEGVVAQGQDLGACGVNWVATEPAGSFISAYLSNDGGTTWDRVANGEWHAFARTGKDLRYRLILIRGKAEHLRVNDVVLTLPTAVAATPEPLPATAAPVEQEERPAFLETFDTGLDAASNNDGALRVYSDSQGSMIGPGSLLVVGAPGNGYGSVWLAKGLDYDPAAAPYLDFWLETRSRSYTAIWVELSDAGLKRDGLSYTLADGRIVTPLLLVSSSGLTPPSLHSLGDLQAVPDGHRQHLSFNLNDALNRLFGPGPHRVTGLRLVNYVDPGGAFLRFDQISARSQPLPG